jgi:heme iron utilization protein
MTPPQGEERERLENEVGELLSRQHLAVLATHEEGQPYASLVTFAATADLKHLYFATPRATRKYRNLSRDARAAFLIDSRENSAADIAEAIAVTATGNVRELEGGDLTRARETLIAHQPHLEAFYSSPSCAVLALEVTRYIKVGHFQEVMELDVR